MTKTKIERLTGPCQNVSYTQDSVDGKRFNVCVVKESQLQAAENLIEAQERLLVCYRIGHRRGLDNALDMMESAKKELQSTQERRTP